jgi:WD40 repeat protein
MTVGVELWPSSGQEGAGSVGKTTLAQAVSQDAEVRAHFVDGTVWVRMGMDTRDLVPKLRLVAEALGDDLGGPSTAKTATKRLNLLLPSLTALIVLDDVGDASQVIPFLSESGQCRVLLTSRHRHVAVTIDADCVELGLFDSAQAESYVSLLAGRCDPKLKEIAEALDGHPVSIRMALASMDAATFRWFRIVSDGMGQLDTERRERDLGLFIRLRLDLLEPDQRELYNSLGILEDASAVPDSILLRFWKRLLPRVDPRKLLGKLLRLDLIQIDDKGQLSLGPPLAGYVKAEVGARSREFHREWITEFLREDDAYILGHLRHHILGADAVEELQAYLVDFDWLEQVLTTCGVEGLLSYFGAVPPTADSAAVEEIIRCASAGIALNYAQLRTQIIAWLPATEDRPALKKCVERATSKCGGTWLKPVAILSPKAAPQPSIDLGNATGRYLDCTSAMFSDDERLAVVDTYTGRALKSGEVFRTEVWNLELRKMLWTKERVSPFEQAISKDGKQIACSYAEPGIELWQCEGSQETYVGPEQFKAPSLARFLATILCGVFFLISVLAYWSLKRPIAFEIGALKLDPKEVGAIGGSLLLFLLVRSLWKVLKWLNKEVQFRVALSPSKALFCQMLRPFWIGVVWDITSKKVTGKRVGLAKWAIPESNGLFSVPRRSRFLRWRTGEDPDLLDIETGVVHPAHWITRSVYAEENRGRIFLFNSQGGKIEWTDLYDNPRAAGCSGSGRYVLFTNDGRLKLWEPCNRLRQLGHFKSIEAVALSPSGGYAASASQDLTIKLWDVNTGRQVATLLAHESSPMGLQFTDEGRRLVSLDSQRGYVWEVRTDTEILYPVVEHAREARKENTFCTGCHGRGDLKFLQYVEDKKYVHTAHQKGDWGLEWNPGRNMLTSVGPGPDDKALRVLSERAGPLNSVAFTANGRYAFSGSRDGIVRLLNLETCSEEHELRGHSKQVTALSISADGKWGISVSEDRSLRVWDVSKEMTVAMFSGKVVLTACDIAEDLGTVVAGDAEGRLFFFRVEGLNVR